jgi:hypothetical protein
VVRVGRRGAIERDGDVDAAQQTGAGRRGARAGSRRDQQKGEKSQDRRRAFHAGNDRSAPAFSAQFTVAGAVAPHRSNLLSMPQSWIWMQIAIVVFVVIGMIIAIVKLA